MKTNTYRLQHKINQTKIKSTLSTMQTVAILLLLVITASGAAFAQDEKTEFLNVFGRYPLEGAALENQITIYFDKEPVLAPMPDGTIPPVFTIQPPLQGEYTTTGNFVSLKFGDLPKEPNQIYEVQLNPAIQSKDGKPLNPEQCRFFFSNFSLDIQRWWVIERNTTQIVFGLLLKTPVDLEMLRSHIDVRKLDGEVIPFTFLATPRKYTCLTVEPLKVDSVQWQNYAYDEQVFKIVFGKPVSPQVLQNNLSVTTGPNAVPVPAEVITPNDNIRMDVKIRLFQLPPETTASSGNEVIVTLKKGLEGVGGEVLIDTYTKKLFRQPSNLRFADTWWNTRWNYRMNDKDGLVLNVRLSKYARIEDIRKHFEIAPAVDNLRLEPQSGGFQVYGDWNSKEAYEIKITPGFIDGEGKMLEKTLRTSVKTNKVPAYLGLGKGSEYYFPRRNGLALPLETRNLDKIEIVLYRMFPSNLVVALGDMRNGEGSYRFNNTWSEEVARTEIKVTGTPDRLTETPLDLDTLFPQDKKGVFCLRAVGTAEQDVALEQEGYDDEGYYHGRNQQRSATKLVLWTNMGVLAHWQNDELALFAHDLYSLEPVELAKVSIYSTKNQLLGSGNTDSSGIARLAPFDPKLGYPRVAVVEREGDFTFLQLTPRQEDVKEFTDQMPRYDRDGYDAFVYADRDLYRPGETIHARWLVRTHYGDAVPDVPLLVTVNKPN